MKRWLILIVALMLASTGMARGVSDAPGVSAGQALRQLLEGNGRYVQNHPEHPNQRPSGAAQHPIAVILSCSDSRVPPEIAFDQGVGDLFIVRVAGNTYDRLALESIEYAVDHLGTNLVVVMGHDQCGAVTAAVKSYPDAHAGPMIHNIYPAVRQSKGKPGDPVSNAISANAILLAQWLAHDEHFAAKVKNGQIKVVAARYGLDTGKVEILTPQ
jgi:carbonic anhydrase